MIGRKKKKHNEREDDAVKKKKSQHLQRELEARKLNAKMVPHLEEQFLSGRLYACIASRPGQSGHCNGHIFEGKVLEFVHPVVLLHWVLMVCTGC